MVENSFLVLIRFEDRGFVDSITEFIAESPRIY